MCSFQNKFHEWIKEEDYIRMDGSTGVLCRKKLTTNFNDASNERSVCVFGCVCVCMRSFVHVCISV